MVRLKDVAGALAYPFRLFQFHYGTIKSVASYTDPLELSLFQFHYGTIKSTETRTGSDTPLEFQFHYGTIKR